MRTGLKCAGFHGCCGVNIIYDFYGAYKAEDHIADIEDYLKRRSSGIYLVTLNSEQRRLFHDVVLKAGFVEIVKQFYNPNSGNKVSLYSKTVVSDKGTMELMPRKTANSLFQYATILAQ